jgi:hypothetical protein
MIDKANEHEGIIAKLKELELESLSPIEAWKILSELQNEILGET